MNSIKSFENEKIDLTNHSNIIGGDTTMTCWEDVGCSDGYVDRYYQVTSDDGTHLNSYTLRTATLCIA